MAILSARRSLPEQHSCNAILHRNMIILHHMPSKNNPKVCPFLETDALAPFLWYRGSYNVTMKLILPIFLTTNLLLTIYNVLNPPPYPAIW